MLSLFVLCVFIAASLVAAELEENSARLLLYKVRQYSLNRFDDAFHKQNTVALSRSQQLVM